MTTTRRRFGRASVYLCIFLASLVLAGGVDSKDFSFISIAAKDGERCDTTVCGRIPSSMSVAEVSLCADELLAGCTLSGIWTLRGFDWGAPDPHLCQGSNFLAIHVGSLLQELKGFTLLPPDTADQMKVEFDGWVSALRCQWVDYASLNCSAGEISDRTLTRQMSLYFAADASNAQSVWFDVNRLIETLDFGKNAISCEQRKSDHFQILAVSMGNTRFPIRVDGRVFYDLDGAGYSGRLPSVSLVVLIATVIKCLLIAC